jgi:hypothetical protein
MRRDKERKTYFLKKRKKNFRANVRLRADQLEVAGEINFTKPWFSVFPAYGQIVHPKQSD